MLMFDATEGVFDSSHELKNEGDCRLSYHCHTLPLHKLVTGQLRQLRKHTRRRSVIDLVLDVFTLEQPP